MNKTLRLILACLTLCVGGLSAPTRLFAATALEIDVLQGDVDVLAVLKSDRNITFVQTPSCQKCIEFTTPDSAAASQVWRGEPSTAKPSVKSTPVTSGPIDVANRIVTLAGNRRLLFVVVKIGTDGTFGHLVYELTKTGTATSLLRIKTTLGGYTVSKAGEITFNESINPRLPSSNAQPCPTEGRREIAYKLGAQSGATQTRVTNTASEKSAWCGVEAFYREMLAGPSPSAYQRLSRQHQETRPYATWAETYATTRVGLERMLYTEGDTFTVLASETGSDRITLFYRVTWQSEWDSSLGQWRITLLSYEPTTY